MARKYNSTAYNVEKRINEMIKFIIAGMNIKQIAELVNNPKDVYKWNVTETQLYSYKGKAIIELSKLSEPDKKKQREIALNRYGDLYYKSYTMQDFKGAASMQDRINILLGLNEPEKLKIQDDRVKTDDLDLIERLLTKVKEIKGKRKSD